MRQTKSTSLIGMSVEQAKQYGPIRVTRVDGIALSVDKKHNPERRNVSVEHGKIVSESDRG